MLFLNNKNKIKLLFDDRDEITCLNIIIIEYSRVQSNKKNY